MVTVLQTHQDHNLLGILQFSFKIKLSDCLCAFTSILMTKIKFKPDPMEQTPPTPNNSPSSFLFSIFDIPFPCSNHHQFIKVFSLSATIFHQSEGKTKNYPSVMTYKPLKRRTKKEFTISIPINNRKFTMITSWSYLNRTCSIGSYIQRIHFTVYSVQRSSIELFFNNHEI